MWVSASSIVLSTLLLLLCRSSELPEIQVVTAPEPMTTPAFKVHLLQRNRSTADHSSRWPAPHYRVIEMRTSRGQSYSCYTPTSQYDTTVFADESSSAGEPAVLEVTERLNGRCETYSSRGDFWKYEICHGIKVVQFHQKSWKSERTQVNTLGIYLRKKKTKDGPVHMYDGGSKCKLPNGKTKRRTVQVDFKCGRELRGASRARILAAHNAPKPASRIVDVQEPRPCEYSAVVFSPLACTSEAEIVGSNTEPDELIKRLGKSCVHRSEGWWNYELCFGSHLRQFHAENDKVVTEFNLGNFSKLETVPNTVVMDPITNKPYLEQHYGNGTSCDLSGQARSTQVRFVCSQGSAHLAMLDLVKETATCNYLAVVSTPLLCTHKQFKVKKREKRGIHCVDKD